MKVIFVYGQDAFWNAVFENGEEIGRVVRPDRAALQALLAPLAAGRQ